MAQLQSQAPVPFSGYELLHRISLMMDGAANRADIIKPVLQEIGPHLEQARLAVSLLNRDTGYIEMEEAFGLSEEQLKVGRYRKGEGITGNVVKTGKPAVLVDVKENPVFLNRTSDRQSFINPGFVCVPIKLEGKIIGTFSGMWERTDEAQVHEVARLFAVIASLIAGAVRFRQIDEEKQRLQNQLQEKYRPKNIIGNSKPMRQLYMQMGQVSKSDTTVLLRGESGVGKELVASAIHYSSNRVKGPFVKVNCAALPENILESELFGHERGAFTGAIRQRAGRFEQAHGGTLFLDEIGDFSPGMQVSLLRALQEKEFHRVGGDRPIRVDVRIIAATNRDLEALMVEELFRADLYYRLAVFPISIPPLRARKEDINTLCDYFVEKYNSTADTKVRRITTPALNALMTYQWPGNVRELQNCIERAILVADGPVIQESDLPPSLQTASTSDTRTEGRLQAILESKEKEIISETIIETRGNMARAARMLGITERQMGCRVKKYQINPKAYR